MSATQLERLKEATEAVEEGLKACANGGGNNNDKVLLKRQLMLVDKKRKAVEQREARKQKREHRTHSVKDMLRQRGIQVSRRACYAQQREYGRTTPRWDEESGSWCWPLLLVYPTQAHGDQSDYVESVSEDATLRQVMELVFGNGEQQQMRPWWDVDNAYGNVNDLQVMLRQKRVEGEMDNIADAGDSDSDDEDEDEENGWQMEDKVQWTILDEQQRIGQVVTRRSYVVPLYPVLHIVPKAAARALANGCLQ